MLKALRKQVHMGLNTGIVFYLSEKIFIRKVIMMDSYLKERTPLLILLI